MTITMLTWDTAERLSKQKAESSFTEKEQKQIEHLLYVSNMGASTYEEAWERFKRFMREDLNVELV